MNSISLGFVLCLAAFSSCVPTASTKSDSGSDAGPSLQALQIVTDTLLPGKAGLAYHDQLVATGAASVVTWSIISASADTKNWMAIDSATGAISGTPTKAFDWETVLFQVAETASGGRSAQKGVQIKVTTCLDQETAACNYASNGVCMLGEQKCVGGTFSPTCAPLAPSQTSSDINHCDTANGQCSSCGPRGNRCDNGNCSCGVTGPCSDGSTCCTTEVTPTCRNLASDPANCGTCGNNCVVSAQQPLNHVNIGCGGSNCTYSCSDPLYKDCNDNGLGSDADGCETHVIDNNNCGACGKPCQLASDSDYAGTAQCQPDGTCLITCSQGQRCGNGCYSPFNKHHCGLSCIDCQPPPGPGGFSDCLGAPYPPFNTPIACSPNCYTPSHWCDSTQQACCN